MWVSFVSKLFAIPYVSVMLGCVVTNRFTNQVTVMSVQPGYCDIQIAPAINSGAVFGRLKCPFWPYERQTDALSNQWSAQSACCNH